MVELLFLLGGVILLMCGLDWLLSKIVSDWKPMPWEENEWQ